MTLAYLRRGLLAGLVAGLLAGLFGFAFGEPALDEAIMLEESSHAGEEHAEEVFDRGQQKAGLILATGIYGAAAGCVFGLVSAYFRSRVSARSEWARSLGLAVAIFAGAVLSPFLKYPPNPPGVGVDPETLATRTAAYLAMVALSLLALFFAWRLARQLEGFAAYARHLLVGAFVLVAWALLASLLPNAGSDGDAPAGLVWSFRLSSLGTQAVLWAGIGVVFGLLGERAEAREGRGVSKLAAEGGTR